MRYGINNLSIVPLRLEPSDKSELVSQVLYGDTFKVLEQRKSWSKIQLSFDAYEGWIDNKQFVEITQDEYNNLNNEPLKISIDLVEFVENENKQLFAIFVFYIDNNIIYIYNNMINHDIYQHKET